MRIRLNHSSLYWKIMNCHLAWLIRDALAAIAVVVRSKREGHQELQGSNRALNMEGENHEEQGTGNQRK